MLLTLSVSEVLPATPRTSIVRIGLGGRSFPYHAGQAVFVGIHGDSKRRPYSLAAAPEDARRNGCLELLIAHDHGGPAAPLPMKAGVQVDVDGPVGGFTLPVTLDERRFIFIAGGSGIAPLRAMLRQALGRPHPEIALLYSARTPDEFAYEDELRQLADEARIGFRQTITRSSSTDTWTGGRGRLAAADLVPFIHDPATLCFVCGPPAFVRDIERLLQELGVARERIHIERWRAPGPPPPDMLADSKDPRGSDRRRAHFP